MSDCEQAGGLESLDLHDDLEELVVVPPRKGSSGALVPAIALIMVALGFLVVRSNLQDWRGIEAKRPVLARSAPAPETAPQPPVKPATKPTPPRWDKAKADATAPSEVAKVDPMAEITREAERKRQEKDELERLKDKAANELARAPHRPVPPQPMINPMQQRQMAELFARRRQAMDRMVAQLPDRHRQMFQESMERQRQFQQQFAEQFAGHRPGMPFGGMADFPPPFPELPAQGFPIPPGRQFHQEHRTFVLPGGGRGEFHSTIIIQGFDNTLGQ
jgi:hypothetical protein